MVARRYGVDVSAFRFDKVCGACAGMDVRGQRGFLSDVKRAAYAVGREIQCSLLEQEQAIRPDEFSVEAPRPEKARSSKGKEEPDR
mgnify:FL=1